MTVGPALLVVLLCVFEAGGTQETPSLSDVWREVRVLRGMVEDLRGDNEVMAAKLSASQKQVEVLQTRLGTGEDQCCCNHTLIQSLQTRLSTTEDQVENSRKEMKEWMKEKDKLVKDLDQLQSRYNNLTGHCDDLESRCTKPTETTPTETKPTETKPTETTPTETTPTETKPTETKPTETTPTETTPTETTPTETKPTETTPTETTPTETKPTETKPTETKPTESPEELKRRLCVMSCPSGWKQFGCSCYHMSTEWKSWEDSRQDCLKMGADLVVINSTEEQEFIRGLDQYGGGSWVGLKKTGDNWIWVNGIPATAQYWNSGRPANYGNCGGYYHSLGGCYDASCTDTYKWICEK